MKTAAGVPIAQKTAVNMLNKRPIRCFKPQESYREIRMDRIGVEVALGRMRKLNAEKFELVSVLYLFTPCICVYLTCGVISGHKL
jgi:hypothetical protein